jgi:hypothetical protein
MIHFFIPVEAEGRSLERSGVEPLAQLTYFAISPYHVWPSGESAGGQRNARTQGKPALVLDQALYAPMSQ